MTGSWPGVRTICVQSDDAVPQAPKTKKQVNMRVDPDVLAFFKAGGRGHLTRMHAVLRSYVDAQKKRHTRS